MQTASPKMHRTKQWKVAKMKARPRLLAITSTAAARGGKGVRDIKTTARNGKVVDVLSVIDSDEVLMVTSRGKIQRIRASDINIIGRNTQGVRIIRLDEGDTLVSCAVIPGDVIDEEAAKAAAAVQIASATEKPAVPEVDVQESTELDDE